MRSEIKAIIIGFAVMNLCGFYGAGTPWGGLCVFGGFVTVIFSVCLYSKKEKEKEKDKDE